MNIGDTITISAAVAFPIFILTLGLSLWLAIRRLERKQE